MNSFEPYLFALHSYRNFYQVVECLSEKDPINAIDTIGFISQVGKTFIDFGTLLDSIPGREKKQIPGLFWLEGGFRCCQIGSSLYLLYKNPPGLDRKSHQLQILMEILNIGRIALQILRPTLAILPYIQLALCGADALLKAPMIMQKLVDSSVGIRAIIEAFSLLSLFTSGCSILLSSSNAARQAMGILSFSAFAIHTLAQIVFEEMNILPSPRRDLFQWTCVALGSSAITMVAMIKLGISTTLVSSIGGIAQALIFAAGAAMIVESVRRAYRVLTGGPIMNWRDLIEFNQYVGLSIILQGVTRALNPI